MRRLLWYYWMWLYLRTAFFFFYRKFNIIGRENIPKKRVVLFLPNHQNTFLDALIIATSQSRLTHYMARADVFTNKRLIWLMSTINLRPIYRMRDGRRAVEKNEQVFNELQDFMNHGECVMIHPEGSHSLKYYLRPLSKGFTRLAFGFLEKFPDKELDIVPVGVNYSAHTRFRSEVSVIYGPPINVRPFYEKEDQNQAALELKELVADHLKPLINHLDDEGGDQYDETFARLKAAGANFADHNEVKKMLARIKEGKELPPLKKHSPGFVEKLLYPIVYLNNWAVVLVWKKLKPTFKDKAWHGPMKYALGITLVPLAYLLQTFLVWALLDWKWAAGYLLFSMVTVPVLRIGQS